MTRLTRHLIATASDSRRLLEREAVGEIRCFLRAQQNDDGGFSGRDGRSDLYYTGFGVGALLALGARPAFSIRRYLTAFGEGVNLDFVHLACLVRCRAAMHSRRRSLSVLLRQLERYRSADGAYAHTATGCTAGTAYATYFALLAYQDAGVPVPDTDRLLQAVQAPAFTRGEVRTTPGMAAVATVCTHLGSHPPDGTMEWLLEQATKRGGFRASPEAPVADLLSTATALYALLRLDRIPSVAVASCEDFVEQCWTDDGGFGGHPGDATADSEYTFYALLALGCLAEGGGRVQVAPTVALSQLVPGPLTVLLGETS